MLGFRFLERAQNRLTLNAASEGDQSEGNISHHPGCYHRTEEHSSAMWADAVIGTRHCDVQFAGTHRLRRVSVVVSARVL